MAIAKNAVHPEKTLSALMTAKDKSDWEWVEIPAVDRLGYAQTDFSINNFIFEAGKKHFVPPQVAEQLRERVQRFEEETLRLLMPNQNARVKAALRRLGHTDMDNLK